MKFTVLILFLSILFAACSSTPETTKANELKLVQVSVIDALLQGIYDGTTKVGDLTKHGSYGIGTFNGLDGEMVVFNDTVFQVNSKGEVVKPSAETMTPFAAVTNVKADTVFSLKNISFEDLKKNFDQYFPTKNWFYVVKIKGEFSTMKTRSVPKQEKPYPALVEVTKHQPEFEFENVKGDIIGFYTPEFAKGINVTGLHLHFLNASRTGGGHILSFNLKQGEVEIGYIKSYKLLLPSEGEFFAGDFSKDRSDELKQAEQ